MIVKHEGRSGFTLIELLVVIAIIAVLAAILFPVMVSAREAGRRARCVSNLKQLGTAFRQYASDNGERWPHLVLDYVTQGKAANGMDIYVHAPGSLYWTQQVERYVKNKGIFVCPSQVPSAKACCDPDSPDFLGQADWPYSYGMNWYMAGNRDFFYIDWEKSGGSAQHNCILLAECNNVDWIWTSRWDWFKACWWVYTEENGPPRWEDHGRHGKGANFLCADGHVAQSKLTDKPGKPYWMKA